MSDNERNTPSSDITAIGVAALILALIAGAIFGGRHYVASQHKFATIAAELSTLEAEDAAMQQLELLEEQLQQEAKLRLVAWNIQSGGNDAAVIAEQLVTDLERYDIYGLTEVYARNTRRHLDSIQDAHGAAYKSFVSVAGRAGRTTIVYDLTRLKALENAELEAYHGVRINDLNFGAPVRGWGKSLQDMASRGSQTVSSIRSLFRKSNG